MSLHVNLDIAKTQLHSRKRQTIIAILGVMFGIAMFILMISFMKGTNQFLQDAMLSSTPDIHIYNDAKPGRSNLNSDEFSDTAGNQVAIGYNLKPGIGDIHLENVDTIVADLKKNNKVAAVSPVLSTQVFFGRGAVRVNGIIDGVNIQDEISLYGLSEKMVDGAAEDLQPVDNGILLGKGLANKLNVHAGDVIFLTSAIGTAMRLKVIGIFQFGIGMVDNVKGFLNLSTVQKLLGKDSSYVTDIHVKLKDLDNAKNIAASLAVKYDYRADDWQTANSSVLASTMVRNVLTYVVTFALLIVAGFGIYNIMSMTVANKLKDIAILGAQGFRSRDVVTIFLSQSLFIGIVGALLGLLLGFFLAYGLSRIPFPQSDLISLKYFPVLFKLKYYIWGMTFGIVTTVVAGLTPSVKASKLDPVIILRG